MSDLPKSIEIHEEGPREGFQIEPGPIATQRKIELIDALSETGLQQIQIASYVNPRRVPGWADAVEVVDGYAPRAGVRYSALWLNEKGLERALAQRGRLTIEGRIALCASERFLMRNQNRNLAENIGVQHGQIALFKANGIAVEGASMMAAFGCNYEGDVSAEKVLEVVATAFEIAAEHGITLRVRPGTSSVVTEFS
jgi:hydroxymethylglutaryl-CoA lyase